MRIAVLAFAGLALLASACASKQSTGSGSGSGSGTRSISVTSPANGATVSSPVILNLVAHGAQIGTPDTGKMHFHIYVDNSSQYTIAYTTRASIPVPPGKHTLRIVLAEPNHTETSTTTSITVTVKGAGTSPSPSPTGGGGGYGY
jgi:hypothetical protein